MNIKDELFKLQDSEYRDFHARLVPNLEKKAIIGVRLPQLRALAKELKPQTESFFKELPHRYYEENTLHAILISEISDFDKCVKELNEFLPYVDNWATCDSMRPKSFKKNRKKLISHIDEWLKSSHTYTVRFAVGMLMTHFLDEDFDEKYMEKVSRIKSDEYYINMMIAWYFQVALVKKWEFALPYLKEKRLSKWVHNKAIQKARESYRMTQEQKDLLKSLTV